MNAHDRAVDAVTRPGAEPDPTADIYPDLTDEEAALLASLLEPDGIGADAEPTIGQRAPADSHALSFAQERLWLLDQLEPGSTAYTMPFGIRLRGTLDAGALKRSLQAIVERHDALQTRFLV